MSRTIRKVFKGHVFDKPDKDLFHSRMRAKEIACLKNEEEIPHRKEFYDAHIMGKNNESLFIKTKDPNVRRNEKSRV